MRAKHKDIIGSTTVSTSVEAPLYDLIAKEGNISQTIRTAVDAWVAAEAPIVPAPYRRTNVTIGGYFSEDDYYTIRAYAIARNQSIAKAIRMALCWYYYHRG